MSPVINSYSKSYDEVSTLPILRDILIMLMIRNIHELRYLDWNGKRQFGMSKNSRDCIYLYNICLFQTHGLYKKKLNYNYIK